MDSQAALQVVKHCHARRPAHHHAWKSIKEKEEQAHLKD